MQNRNRRLKIDQKIFHSDFFQIFLHIDITEANQKAKKGAFMTHLSVRENEF